MNKFSTSPPKKPFNPLPIWLFLWIAIIWLIVFDLDISLQMLFYGLKDIAEYFSRYSNPDFSDINRYLQLLAETIATALWGTFIALFLGFLLAPFAARNLTHGRILYRISRETLNFLRAMPDMLLGLIFVAALGLGPLPSALALGLHSAGFLGKFFAESLERIDKGIIEAVQATGASKSQVVMYAGWPSILRESIGYSLYILDRNVRMASVLGLVGAGGIGLALYNNIKMFNYNESTTLILLILSVILIFDYFSTWLRRKLT